MGGFGSGRYYRGSGRLTCEDTKRIDIRYLNKNGLLNPHRSGTLSWNIGGEPSGNINYIMYENSMVLKFKWQRCYSDDDWESEEQEIWFDRTRCNYGGKRKWFLCPHCGKRVAVLYGADIRFLCRHCYRLPYSSQGESYLDRMERKADKINLKLDPDGLEEDYYYKPKGMHWKTFNRLIATNNCLQEAIERGFLYKFRYWL